MSKRHDNTNRSSEFICLRCLSKNQVGDKMRRPNMREKDHVKNLCCLCTKLQMSEYYGAAEPPVRCGESHLSGLTEPLRSL